MKESGDALYCLKGLLGLGIFMAIVAFFVHWWGWSTGSIALALFVAIVVIVVGKLLFERQ